MATGKHIYIYTSGLARWAAMGGDTTPKMHQENLSLMATGKHIYMYIYKWSSAVSGHGWGHNPENALPCEKGLFPKCNLSSRHKVKFAYQCSYVRVGCKTCFQKFIWTGPPVGEHWLAKSTLWFMPHLLNFGKIFFHRAVHFRGRVPTHWRARLEGVGGPRGSISKGQVHLKGPALISEFRKYRLRACAHPEVNNSVLGGPDGWLWGFWRLPTLWHGCL